MLVLLGAAVMNLSAQNSRLDSFRSNFSGANRETKLELLRSTGNDDAAEFGPLYRQALQYVFNNANDIRGDRTLRDILLLATERVDEGQFRPAVPDVWSIFQVYDESTSRIRMLGVIGRHGHGSDAVISGLVDWVRRQHLVAQGGGRPDYQVLAAAVAAIGNLGDSRGYSAVLDTILLQYPGFVVAQARESLSRIDGDPRELALGAIRNRPVTERRPAFAFLVGGDLLDEDSRMELARVVLEDAVSASTGDVQATNEYRNLRNSAAHVIRQGRYAAATSAVIRHFNQTVLEFERKLISSGPLLEAIATMGAMENEPAAERLGSYLRLVNTYTEIDRPYDTQIVLAVITNLESIGSPASYNVLYQTTLLTNYPSRVIERARQAMVSVAQ